MHLTRATGQEATEPAYYHTYFERGIDPDVDDPTKCHDHSKLPDIFPSLDKILEYREKVKERVQGLYADGSAHSDKCIGRALWIGFEHEGELPGKIKCQFAKRIIENPSFRNLSIYGYSKSEYSPAP